MRLLIDLCNLKSSRFACILNCELYSVKVEISWPRRFENSVYSVFYTEGNFLSCCFTEGSEVLCDLCQSMI